MRLTGTRRAAALVAIGVIVAGIAVLGIGFDANSGNSAGAAAPKHNRVLGPGTVTVKIRIDRSKFWPSTIRVQPHTLVQFVLVNRDPIGHEFIIGDAEVHARHQNGTEASHPAVPGEVSIPPRSTATTTYQLHEPGAVEFACHLPGHFEYGMVGEVRVVAASM